MLRKLTAVVGCLAAIAASSIQGGPAQAAETLQVGIGVRQSVVSWGVTYIFVHSGQKATIDGALRPARANKRMDLQYTTNGGASWTRLTTLYTDGNGNVTFNYAPTQTREYRWSFPGDSSATAGYSSNRKVTLYAALASYRNCTDLNARYPHGVGKPNAADSTTSTKVRSFLPSTAAYALNDGGSGQYDLDRDNDGIACEKV